MVRIAALDLGSNSFHLLVAEVRTDGSFEALVREKEMLRLGSVVSRTGRVGVDSADQAVRTVRRFRLLAEAAGANEIEARATSALRAADDSDEVIDRLRIEAGVDVDVIDGLEEARLIFGAVRAAVVLEPPPALALDLGGGSLELMIGDATGLAWSTSEHLGVARLTERFVTADPLPAPERARLTDHIATVLGAHAGRVAGYHPRRWVGSSGTIENLVTLARIAHDGAAPPTLNQVTATAPELRAVCDEIVASTAAQRRRRAGLDTRRVDLVVAGAAVVGAALDVFDIPELTVSEWALREGILLDAIGRHDPADWSDDPRAIRRASVQVLARRCSAPREHSTRVARWALALFDATAALHGLGTKDRELLEYGAQLHDIGEHITHDGHDRHAAYLVTNAGLRGFDPAEIAILAGLVRWHRRGEPKADDPLVGKLDDDARARVRALVALLRVADGLDRSRRGTILALDVAVGDALVIIRVEAGADPELELWGARRKRDLFEKVFGRELELTVHPSTRD